MASKRTDIAAIIFLIIFIALLAYGLFMDWFRDNPWAIWVIMVGLTILAIYFVIRIVKLIKEQFL